MKAMYDNVCISVCGDKRGNLTSDAFTFLITAFYRITELKMLYVKKKSHFASKTKMIIKIILTSREHVTMV